jgi:hypothetical protein
MKTSLSVRLSIKYFFAAVLFLTLLLSTGACGRIKKPPNKEQIKATLPVEITSYSIDDVRFQMTDIEVTIERRQTNDKIDYADVSILMKDEFASRLAYYRLTYVYYDQGGWQLEGYEKTAKTEMLPLSSSLDIEDIKSTVLDEGYAVGELIDEELNPTYEGRPGNIITDNGRLIYRFDINNRFPHCNEIGNVSAHYELKLINDDYDIEEHYRWSFNRVSASTQIDWSPLVGRWHSYDGSISIDINILKTEDNYITLEGVYHRDSSWYTATKEMNVEFNGTFALKYSNPFDPSSFGLREGYYLDISEIANLPNNLFESDVIIWAKNTELAVMGFSYFWTDLIKVE